MVQPTRRRGGSGVVLERTIKVNGQAIKLVSLDGGQTFVMDVQKERERLLEKVRALHDTSNTLGTGLIGRGWRRGWRAAKES